MPITFFGKGLRPNCTLFIFALVYGGVCLSASIFLLTRKEDFRPQQIRSPQNVACPQQIACPKQIVCPEQVPAALAPSTEKPAMEVAVTKAGDKYTYSDTDNQLNCWLNGHESRITGAMDPEIFSWLRAQAYLEKLNDGSCYNTRLMSDSGEGRMVDVGCGMGRIVLKFGILFREVDCIEPDDRRRGMAMDELSKPYESWSHGRVSFHGERFLDWDSKGYVDAVTIIHVVQHISSQDFPKVLKKIHDILSPGGIMVLTTTIGYRGRSYFTLDDGREVDEREFNYNAEHGGPGSRLPVRKFDEQELKAFIENAGMYILENGPYMYHKVVGAAESQYVIATREKDAYMWRHCLPLEYLQSPRVTKMHLVALVERLRLSAKKEC